jgi:exosortase A-associated hydrolase 1
MRRLLTFECEGELLAGTLDEADGETGVLIVTGGSQTRIGSHRVFERLSKTLSNHGFACFRFDRRGVGDSSGEDPGFRKSEADLMAAIQAFRNGAPAMNRVIGVGLCDGATAIALHGLAIGLEGAILINPWLVEAAPGDIAPAAVRAHYRQRLLSAEGWKKLLSGRVDFRKLVSGVKTAGSATDKSLADDAGFGLTILAQPVAVLLASGDATAIAAAAEIKRAPLDGAITTVRKIDTDSHTFARPGDEQALAQAALSALRETQPSG